ncbi:hypothetical protein [Flavobacterium sp.]|uniref:hypothetical protein n=1 Tax=Flavobacterium sp. TaxID=239 RepID=UPI003D0CF743
MKKEKVKNRNLFWFLTFAIAFLGFGSYFYFIENQNETSEKAMLGTCNSPEEAFEETQKALNLVSTQLNSGIKNAHSLKAYENTTHKIFKKE